MIWEMKSTKTEIRTNEKTSGTAWTSTASGTLKQGFNSRRAVQVMVPLASALFIALYWIYALNIYNKY
jgi:hypothetical protein